MNYKRTKYLGAVLGIVVLSQAAIACSEDPAASSPAATEVVAAATAQSVATYVVQRDDRLVDIAAEFDVPLGVLLELNDFPNPDVIEIGDVIVLEARPDEVAEPAAAAPVATSAPLPRIVQVEPVDESFSERMGQWWDDAPKPSLTGDAVEQGIFAAVALPAAVIAFVLLMIVGRQVVRLSRGAMRLAFARSSEQSAREQSPESGDSEVRANSRRRLPSFAFIGSGVRRVARGSSKMATRIRALGIGWLTRPFTAAARVTASGVRWGIEIVVRASRAIGRMLHLNARRAAEVHAARRERARDEEFRRESRGWWSQGRERLRIGLLDEAEECFETGLRLAVEGDWEAEIELYRSELQLLEERRNVERSMVPSVHEV